MEYKLNKSIVHLKNELEFSGIYCIKNLTNNKCYVGSSKNIFNRLRYHISQLNNNNHTNNILQNDWNKFRAIDFTVKILELVEGAHNNRLIIECKWIKKLEGYPYGYNLNLSTHGYRSRKYENQYYPKFHLSQLTTNIAATRFQNGEHIFKIARDYGCDEEYVRNKIITYVNENNLEMIRGG